MESSLYQKIYHIISLIPSGKVATYSQIAAIVEGCTTRIVRYAASVIKQDSNILSKRVINCKGGISQSRGVSAGLLQQKLLEAEGILLNQDGRKDLKHYLWKGE